MSEKLKLKALLGQYASLRAEMAEHPWMRNRNSPLADLAENLVAEALNGAIAANNAKGYDVELSDGRLIQVKSATYQGKDNLVTGAIRSEDFDSVAIVICDPDFRIVEGLLLPKERLIEVSKFHKSLNGYQIKVKQARSASVDITEQLRAVW